MGMKEDCLDIVTEKIPIVRNENTDNYNLCVGIFKYLLYIIPVCVIIGVLSVPQWHHKQVPVEGSSIGKVYGTLTSGNMEMDVQDYTLNQNMPDSFFIATQLDITEQERSTNCSGGGKNKWCTKPGTNTKQYRLTGIEDLTVLIKNWVVFTGGGSKKSIKWSNINAFHNKTHVRDCQYNPTDKTNKYCPVFKIGTILELAGQTSSSMNKGGVINIEFNWKCNAHESKMKNCKPTIKFKRADNINVTEKGGGVNFRHANYYGQSSRDLVKATGIRFIIITTGYGYWFDLLALVIRVGGMLGYTSLITFGAASLIVRIQSCRGKREPDEQLIEMSN